MNRFDMTSVHINTYIDLCVKYIFYEFVDFDSANRLLSATKFVIDIFNIVLKCDLGAPPPHHDSWILQ